MFAQVHLPWGLNEMPYRLFWKYRNCGYGYGNGGYDTCCLYYEYLQSNMDLCDD